MGIITKEDFLHRFPKNNGPYLTGAKRAILTGAGFSTRQDCRYKWEKILEYYESKKGNSHYSINYLSNTFETSNIETILRNLFISHKTSKALAKSNKILEEGSNIFLNEYKSIRDILIELMTLIPNIDIIKGKLNIIADFLSCFDNVFSLSYDPIIYWSFMNESSAFCDYFFKEDFDPYRPVFEIGEEKRDKTFVGYLHGTIYLLVDENGNVKKSHKDINDKQVKDISNNQDETCLIKATKQYLQDHIGSRQLIISEGDFELKREAIRANYYLNFIYNKLFEFGEYNFDNIMNEFCIVGFSASDYDKHIIEAFKNYKNTRFTLCVWKDNQCTDKSIGDIGRNVYSNLIRELDDIKKNGNRNNIDYDFYDISEPDSLPSDIGFQY